MNWRVEFAPEVEQDVAEAADWYEIRQPGLGAKFVEEIIRVWDALKESPLLHSRRHPKKDIRWRYPERFPYRVIYEVDETKRIVKVAAVLHAARHDRQWRKRLGMTRMRKRSGNVMLDEEGRSGSGCIVANLFRDARLGQSENIHYLSIAGEEFR